MSDGTLNFPKRATTPDLPTSGRSKIWVDGNDNEPYITDGDTGQTTPFKGAFGANLQLDERLDEQTTTSTTWQTYLNINYNSIDPTSTYRMGLQFVWGYSSASTDFEARMLINNEQYGEIFKVEPKDGGTDQRNQEYMLAWLSEARFSAWTTNNQVQIQFRASNGGNTARMYKASVEFWRIS